MKKQLIKIPALILALMLAFPVSSFAIIPLGYYVAVSGALHVAGAVTGLYYYMKDGSSSTVASDGKVSRPSNATWIDLTLETPAVVTKPVTASKTMSQIKSAVDKNPASYPNLKNAVYSPNVPALSSSVVGQPALNPYDGKVYNVSVHSVASYTVTTVGNPGGEYTLAGGSGFYVAEGTSGTSTIWRWHYVGFNTSTPVVVASVPSTPSQFKSIVAPTGTALSPYQAELDKALQDPDYTPTFTDDTTGLPWTPPPSSQVATPKQVDAYNSGQAAAEAAAGQKAAAEGAVSTAQSNYNANPTPENDQALKNAQTVLAGVTAGQAKDKAGKAEDEANAESVSVGLDTGTAYGDKSDSELSLGERFKTFVDQMQTTAVFSLPNQFLSNIPTSSDSVMTFNGGRYGEHSFDFASLSMLWIALKTVVLVMFGWFSIRIVTLKGGGG